MSRPVRELVLVGRQIEVSEGCPAHLTVEAIERCPRCLGRLMAQLEKRRRLDEAMAVPAPGPAC